MGADVGDDVGRIVGVTVGPRNGFVDGITVGIRVGDAVGVSVGKIGMQHNGAGAVGVCPQELAGYGPVMNDAGHPYVSGTHTPGTPG